MYSFKTKNSRWRNVFGGYLKYQIDKYLLMIFLIFYSHFFRRPLFREGVIMRHPQGRGREAFTWQGTTVRESYEEGTEGMEEGSTPCTGTLFTEPVKWMEQSIVAVEGKVGC